MARRRKGKARKSDERDAQPATPPRAALDPATLKRLRLFRVLVVVAPLITLAAFLPIRWQSGRPLPFADGFPDRDRNSLVVFWLASVAASLATWYVGRRNAAWRGPGALACYVLAMWVALVGASSWGRGAPISWFVATYAWAIAVVFAVFPVRRTN